MGKTEEKIWNLMKEIENDLLKCSGDWRFLVQVRTIVKAHIKKGKS